MKSILVKLTNKLLFITLATHPSSVFTYQKEAPILNKIKQLEYIICSNLFVLWQQYFAEELPEYGKLGETLGEVRFDYLIKLLFHKLFQFKLTLQNIYNDSYIIPTKACIVSNKPLSCTQPVAKLSIRFPNKFG